MFVTWLDNRFFCFIFTENGNIEGDSNAFGQNKDTNITYFQIIVLSKCPPTIFKSGFLDFFP